MCRRSTSPWRDSLLVLRDGLPEPQGTTISVFATSPQEPHGIYAANNRGIFRSRNGAELAAPGRAMARAALDQSVQGLALRA